MAHSFSKRISGTTPYYNMIRRVAFPSTRAIILSSLILTTVGAALSFATAEGTLASLLLGAEWGIVALGVPVLLSTIVLSFTVMKEDPLFYFRRCLAFSLFTIIIWVLNLFVAAFLANVISGFVFPADAILMGFFAVIPFRTLGVFSMSRTNFGKRTMFSLLEPATTAVLAIQVFHLPAMRVLTAVVLASLTGATFAFALINLVEINGRKVVGFSPIRMFRAFLMDWLEGENHDLESYLSELGVETEVGVASIAFRTKADSKMKAVFLVSNFHPGPFLNVGSSVLPFLFQSVVSRTFSAVGMVPHGVSGHELNLVSQQQNTKLIEWVLSNIQTTKYTDYATPVTRSKNEIATATSQVFDGCALVTMTTSPGDMEDVPSEVANRLAGLTQGKFRHLALIDAHNCLTGPTTMSPEKVGALEEAALAGIQLSAQQEMSTFKVGASQRNPHGFGLRDGMGAGGIAVVAIEANGQRFAYVNVDGNNMVQGLREDIIGKVKGQGFHDCEVMTTDTHMVNGVVPARLGYHLVGEIGARETLVAEVIATCGDAAENLEPCEVGVVSGQLPLTTLGSKSLRRVMTLVYRTSKLTALTLFPLVLLVSGLSIVFLV